MSRSRSVLLGADPARAARGLASSGHYHANRRLQHPAGAPRHFQGHLLIDRANGRLERWETVKVVSAKLGIDLTQRLGSEIDLDDVPF